MNVPMCVIIGKSGFEGKNGKFYSQVYLHSCCLEYDHDENTYSCWERLINNSKYGKYLLKKHVAHFVTAGFNSL